MNLLNGQKSTRAESGEYGGCGTHYRNMICLTFEIICTEPVDSWQESARSLGYYRWYLRTNYSIYYCSSRKDYQWNFQHVLTTLNLMHKSIVGFAIFTSHRSPKRVIIKDWQLKEECPCLYELQIQIYIRYNSIFETFIASTWLINIPLWAHFNVQ